MEGDLPSISRPSPIHLPSISHPSPIHLPPSPGRLLALAKQMEGDLGLEELERITRQRKRNDVELEKDTTRTISLSPPDHLRMHAGNDVELEKDTTRTIAGTFMLMCCTAFMACSLILISYIYTAAQVCDLPRSAAISRHLPMCMRPHLVHLHRRAGRRRAGDPHDPRCHLRQRAGTATLRDVLGARGRRVPVHGLVVSLLCVVLLSGHRGRPTRARQHLRRRPIRAAPGRGPRLTRR